MRMTLDDCKSCLSFAVLTILFLIFAFAWSWFGNHGYDEYKEKIIKSDDWQCVEWKNETFEIKSYVCDNWIPVYLEKCTKYRPEESVVEEVSLCEWDSYRSGAYWSIARIVNYWYEPNIEGDKEEGRPELQIICYDNSIIVHCDGFYDEIRVKMNSANWCADIQLIDTARICSKSENTDTILYYDCLTQKEVSEFESTEICVKEGKNCKEETSRIMEFVEFSRNDSCVNFRWEIHNSNYEYDLDYILDYGYSTKEAVEFNINNTQLGSSIRYWKQFNDLNITWKWVNEKNFTSVCRYGEWFKKEVIETVCEEYRDLK